MPLLEQEVEVDVANVAEAEGGRPVHVEGLARVELVQHEVRERREGGTVRARSLQRHVGPLVLTVGGADLGDHLPAQLLVVGTLKWKRGVFPTLNVFFNPIKKHYTPLALTLKAFTILSL